MRRVLIINDTRTVITLLKRYIASELTDVLTFEASSKEGALEKLELERFDAVVSGNQMHFIDGLALYKKSREFSANKETPFIIITSFRSGGNLEELKKEGVRNILTSPFSAQELTQKINDVCNPRKNRSSDRFCIPDTKIVVHFKEKDVEAQVVNISSGGALVDLTYSEELAGEALNAKNISVELPIEYGNIQVKDILSRVLHFNVLGFNSDYFPEKIRMGLQFVKISERQKDVLEKVFMKVKEDLSVIAGT